MSKQYQPIKNILSIPDLLQRYKLLMLYSNALFVESVKDFEPNSLVDLLSVEQITFDNIQQLREQLTQWNNHLKEVHAQIVKKKRVQTLLSTIFDEKSDSVDSASSNNSKQAASKQTTAFDDSTLNDLIALNDQRISKIANLSLNDFQSMIQ